MPTEKRQSADGGEARSLEQLQRLAEQAFVKRVAGVKAKREEQENQINEQVKKLSNKARRKAKKKAKRVARRKEKSAQKSKAYRERRRGKE